MISCLVVHVGMDARVLAKFSVEHKTIVRLYHRTARRLMGAEAAAGDLEYRAVAVRTASACCAEQVAVGIGEQGALRGATVVSVEDDQGGGGAGVAVTGLGDLEHRADYADPAGCRAE